MLHNQQDFLLSALSGEFSINLFGSQCCKQRNIHHPSPTDVFNKESSTLFQLQKKPMQMCSFMISFHQCNSVLLPTVPRGDPIWVE